MGRILLPIPILTPRLRPRRNRDQVTVQDPFPSPVGEGGRDLFMRGPDRVPERPEICEEVTGDV